MSNIYHTPPTRENRYRPRPGLRIERSQPRKSIAIQSDLLAWLSGLAVVAVIVLAVIAIRQSLAAMH